MRADHAGNKGSALNPGCRRRDTSYGLGATSKFNSIFWSERGADARPQPKRNVLTMIAADIEDQDSSLDRVFNCSSCAHLRRSPLAIKVLNEVKRRLIV
jgi:hypothetical protein